MQAQSSCHGSGSPMLLIRIVVFLSLVSSGSSFTTSTRSNLLATMNRQNDGLASPLSTIVSLAMTTNSDAIKTRKLGFIRRKLQIVACKAPRMFLSDESKANGNGGDGNVSSKTMPDPRDLYIFSPQYLEQIDKYRGYRRKLMLRQLYANSTDISASNSTIVRIFNRIVSDGMKDDVRRRMKVYRSDWTDAFKNKRKVFPAILFLYFACLSPAVSFGTIASQITQGSMGIVEFLLSAGVSGMAYAVLCGQPMAFIAPTGLTLAFISGLYRFCSVKGLPFFPTYSWVGIWTSFFFVLLGLGGSSQWIRFCTRFTDEIFNALLSFNFIYEAVVSIKRNFEQATDMDLTMPFVSLAMALTTFWSTMRVATFESGKYFDQKVRSTVKNYGPVSIFIIMTLLNQRPWLKRFSIPTLSVASTFELAGGRSLFVDLNAVPLTVKVLCAFPAVLLTSLFFMDQNISVRVVNNPDNKLKKGSAYNLDMVALGVITGFLSLMGLPWMCGATVQSLNHLRAMTETRFNKETGEPEIINVTETRFTGFVVHALIAATLGILPLLGSVPIPVVSGVFLFLGRKLMSGNSFLQRIRDSFVETSRLPEDHPIRFIGRKKTTIFTAVQVACLLGLWTFKQNSATAIFFPSVIGFLMLIRLYVLPKFFTEDELVDLGDPTPS
jgi:HCO3- transporter family